MWRRARSIILLKLFRCGNSFLELAAGSLFLRRSNSSNFRKRVQGVMRRRKWSDVGSLRCPKTLAGTGRRRRHRRRHHRQGSTCSLGNSSLEPIWRGGGGIRAWTCPGVERSVTRKVVSCTYAPLGDPAVRSTRASFSYPALSWNISITIDGCISCPRPTFVDPFPRLLSAWLMV